MPDEDALDEELKSNPIIFELQQNIVRKLEVQPASKTDDKLERFLSDCLNDDFKEI